MIKQDGGRMNIKEILKKIIYAGFRILPVERNKVLFFSYYGEQYSGSPKYISRYLAGHSKMKQVWAFTDCGKHRMRNARTVRFGHPGYYFHLATAGVIITNYRMPEEFVKRKGQTYIQTWHSSLRLKMIEKDAEDTLPENYVRMAKKDSAQIDYLLAGSGKSRDIFRRAFWYDGPIVPAGTPQCDILFGKNRKISDKVRAHYGIPADGKIALYAPTFRKDHDTSVYDLDTEALIESLTDRFGGKWHILMRLHPHLIGKLVPEQSRCAGKSPAESFNYLSPVILVQLNVDCLLFAASLLRCAFFHGSAPVPVTEKKTIGHTPYPLSEPDRPEPHRSYRSDKSPVHSPVPSD